MYLIRLEKYGCVLCNEKKQDFWNSVKDVMTFFPQAIRWLENN